MSNQPEALRLADALAYCDSNVASQAAAELRRLHEQNQELLKAAKSVLWYEAEDDHNKADYYQKLKMCRDSEEAIRTAIAKATELRVNT